jgi:hypothetical protein
MIESALKVIASEPFGIFILFIMVIGRNLILKADTRFFPKKASELTEVEKKQLKNRKFLGRALLCLFSPFVVFWGYSLCIRLASL